MKTPRLLVLMFPATLTLAAVGCDEDENKRLAAMAEKNLERQADQNRQMAALQREVAQGARQLVEADAKAREKMVVWQRELQTERSQVGRQRDSLEDERRQLASQRRLDPIIAAAITNTALLLACLLPLVLCWHLLHRPAEPNDDQLVAQVLLDDLVAKSPLLLRTENHPAIGVCDDDDPPRLPEDSQRPNQST